MSNIFSLKLETAEILDFCDLLIEKLCDTHVQNVSWIFVNYQL